MIRLHSLGNTHRPKKKIQRVGRGVGSGRGKTSGRGHKGDGSRSGYLRRHTYEGGRMRLFMRLPIRGFTRGRFFEEDLVLSLASLDKIYEEGEVANLQTLREKGILSKQAKGTLRILSSGELTKKISIEAHHFTEKAKEKLEAANISYKLLSV